MLHFEKEEKALRSFLQPIFGEASAAASRNTGIFRRDAKRKPESTCCLPCRGRPTSRRPHACLVGRGGIEVKVTRGTPNVIAAVPRELTFTLLIVTSRSEVNFLDVNSASFFEIRKFRFDRQFSC